MFSSSYSARCESWFAVRFDVADDTVDVWYARFPAAAGAAAAAGGGSTVVTGSYAADIVSRESRLEAANR